MSAPSNQKRLLSLGEIDGNWIELDLPDHGSAFKAVWTMIGDDGTEQCRDDAKRLIARWNACDGITDPENIVPRLLALNDRAPELESRAATLQARCDALAEALRFYADPTRYHGPNQPNTGDKWTDPSAPYAKDVLRDAGSLAREALTKNTES